MNQRLLLALHHTNGISLELINSLQATLGSIEEALTIKEAQLINMGLTAKQTSALKHLNWQAADKALLWQEQGKNHHIIAFDDPDYPKSLANIYNPPLILYGKGKKQTLKNTCFAMVGSRKPTPSACECAYQFACYLAQSGLCIVSGLARGIDAYCHQGALAANGTTIAVMATGIETIYPKQNQSIAEKIIENGLLITAFPLDAAPKAQNFPNRNRFISGLSIGTLVVEAAIKSGSLITARYALEQGREVFAIPGSIYNPYAKGCHHLIQQGAKLVQNVDDILLEYQLNHEQFVIKKTELDDKLLETPLQNLVKCIGYEMTTIDTLLSRSQLETEALLPLLLELELKGIIKAVPGGYMRL